MDEYGQGEGGGQKSRKFCGRHMYMAPLLTYNVEESDPRLGGGCVDLAHVRALVRVLDVPDLK